MRALVLGGSELMNAAGILGLERSIDRPEVAIIDLRDPGALRDVSGLSQNVPRVIVADPAQRILARALAIPEELIVDSCEPAMLGPCIERAVPVARPEPTRIVLVTASRGGTGRSLLVANLARRLAAKRRPTLVVDVTGIGTAGWWLGVEPRPWSDLEGLGSELTAEHVAVVAETMGANIRVIGGAPHAPSVATACAVVRAGTHLADLVLVDAAPLADERTQALAALADRIIVLTYGDAASLRSLELAECPEGAWRVVSQGGRGGDVEAFFVLPRDEGAVARSIGSRSSIGGSLGRAYDVLTELLIEDAGR